MLIGMRPIKEPPMFVNELGIKWWLDKDASSYASSPNARGVSLDNVVVWHIEELDGRRAWAIVRYDKVIFESQVLEEIGAYIDKMKALKAYGHKVE